MTGVHRCSGAADKHRVRDDLLQAGCRLQHPHEAIIGPFEFLTHGEILSYLITIALFGKAAHAQVCHLNDQGYTSAMPTTRPRYQVTETDAVARALDLAAREWPDEPRSRLIRRLLALGGKVLERTQTEEQLARQIAVRETSGKYPDAFDDNYLAELRKDWPE